VECDLACRAEVDLRAGSAAAAMVTPAPVLLAFAVIASLGAFLSRGLDDLQQDG
jgi:hypothetical protein